MSMGGLPRAGLRINGLAPPQIREKPRALNRLTAAAHNAPPCTQALGLARLK
jgi:hypothetical protein